ncbi:MAG: hypothetical protein JXX29_04450 [Deltaproteobacteria bacterium]|nr:hypothetical protein [Deltaproteobacteria bacterium]MBN2670895.1 hypothetical protein [Deltaproteobacteria bacterium]
MTPRKEKLNVWVWGFLLAFSGLLVFGCADDGNSSDDDDSDSATTDADTDTDTDTDADTDSETDSGTDSGEDSETDSTTAIMTAWAASGHADSEAEAFVHWSSEDDGFLISTRCAKCHAGSGLVDFAADGSVDNEVDVSAGPDTIGCTDCHATEVQALTSVTMPSGAVIESSGPGEVVCINCHQGRASGAGVAEDIAEIVAATDTDTSDTDVPSVDEDMVYADLGFTNVHYAAAGATRFGSEAHGGFEYEGMAYERFWGHVEGYSDCVDCHDPHSLEVKVEECAACHTGVETVADIRELRMPGSTADYDGDGELEGMYGEIQTLAGRLLLQIKAYANDNAATDPIMYDSSSHPYWFVDGEVDTDGNAVSYSTWTPALAKAAYNYQFAMKDHGAYAHNAKYIIELLYDSGLALRGEGSMVNQTRDDSGHFNGASEAFRHWDEDDEDEDGIPDGVSTSCATCHSSEGFVTFAETGAAVTEPAALDSGLTCETCHTDVATGEIRRVASVTFPNGYVMTDDGESSNTMCVTCHSGRSSGAAVAEYTADESDTSGWRFQNMHYMAAGATMLGTEANIGFEYEGKTYDGVFGHAGNNDCTYCHTASAEAHTFHVELTDTCTGCHSEATSVETLRFGRATDYDGDGDNTEPLADELQTIADALYVQIQTVEPDLAYSSNYPYWGFTDGTGAWTAALMRAAYNYHLHHTEPGAWAHSTDYMAQLLIDSIEDLGNTDHGFNRP